MAVFIEFVAVVLYSLFSRKLQRTAELRDAIVEGDLDKVKHLIASFPKVLR